MNGLVDLLDGTVEVRLALIPYYTEELKQLARFESGEPNLDIIYSNANEWLLENGVMNLVVLGSNDENTGGTANNPNRNGDVSTIDMTVEDILGVNTSGRITGILGNDLTIDYMKSNQVIWRFQFENLKLRTKKVDEYIEKLEEKLNGKTLREFVNTGGRFDTLGLGSLAKKIFKDNSLINRTSVMVLHGPKNFYQCNVNYQCLHSNYNTCPINYNGNENWKCACLNGKIVPICCHDGSTFLTGDIGLYQNGRAKLLNGLNNNKNCYHRCFVLQYPHHGAPNKALKRFCDLNAVFNIVSYGIDNRYGHPSRKGFFSLSNKLVCVHEKNAFEYEISV